MCPESIKLPIRKVRKANKGGNMLECLLILFAKDVSDAMLNISCTGINMIFAMLLNI